jgi:hypothetical protein
MSSGFTSYIIQIIPIYFTWILQPLQFSLFPFIYLKVSLHNSSVSIIGYFVQTKLGHVFHIPKQEKWLYQHLSRNIWFVSYSLKNVIHVWLCFGMFYPLFPTALTISLLACHVWILLICFPVGTHKHLFYATPVDNEAYDEMCRGMHWFSWRTFWVIISVLFRR